ncbi:uncharacterized protein LOC123539003 [Mercenaria mercenaria]|uniref:uncharacterized protein LOC123539003 n=1 Tax=Mercenaria mercenaria TaxID=6596 RepID=UPI00234F2719|nr:uncharacterized protein LOC123539003 [Mercenaria mercenaria]
MRLLCYTLSLLLFVKAIHSFECFSCKHVDDPFLCNRTVTCSGSEEFCFMNVQGGIYDMGCADNQHCGGVPVTGIVGRSVIKSQVQTQDDVDLQRRSSTCHECCSMDNCNSDLCHHLKPSLCINDETVDCAKMNTLFHICQDTHQAKLVCPKFCNLCKLVDGGWSQWSDWGSCDVTCGKGVQTRVRTCANPAPAFGGLDCVGNATDTRECTIRHCPGVCVGSQFLNSSLTNVARGKSVTLSSLFDQISPGSLMVDGNRASNWPCACTLPSHHPYAVIDLQQAFDIYSMYIVNRGDCCPERLHNLAVFVGNSTSSLTLVARHPAPIGADCTIVFDQPVNGRYVKLLIESDDYLTICELEIYSV